jgi:hypothetical protein
VAALAACVEKELAAAAVAKVAAKEVFPEEIVPVGELTKDLDMMKALTILHWILCVLMVEELKMRTAQNL